MLKSLPVQNQFAATASILLSLLIQRHMYWLPASH